MRRSSALRKGCLAVRPGPGRLETEELVNFARKEIVAALLPDPPGQFALAVQGVGGDRLALQGRQTFPRGGDRWSASRRVFRTRGQCCSQGRPAALNWQTLSYQSPQPEKRRWVWENLFSLFCRNSGADNKRPCDRWQPKRARGGFSQLPGKWPPCAA